MKRNDFLYHIKWCPPKIEDRWGCLKIKKLQERRSVREFTGEKVKDEDLKLILETAQKYPNSVHGQQTSLIVIRDKENIRKVAELSENQEHIKNCTAPKILDTRLEVQFL